MKKLLLILLLFASLAVLGIFGARRWGRTPDTASADSATPAAAPTSAGAAEVARTSEIPTTPDVAPTDDARAAVESQAGADWDRTRSRHLRGEIVFPGGSPADDSLEVLAWTRELQDFELVRRADSKLHEQVVARAPVGGDGRFLLELPPDMPKISVVVAGRYLYCKSATLVTAQSESVVLTPQLGAWVVGRVRTPPDFSLERLSIPELTLSSNPFRAGDGFVGPGMDYERSRTTALEKLDSFEFRGVPPSKAYRMFAAPAGIDGADPELAAGEGPEFELAAGERREVELALDRGGSVLGRVVDEGGAPLEGVKVQATFSAVFWGEGGRKARERLTAADGSFRLPALPATKLRVEAEKEGWIGARQSVELALGDAREVTLTLKAGTRISGLVLWPDRTPAVAVEVRAQLDTSRGGGPEVWGSWQLNDGQSKSDADGRFTIAGLGKGPFLVRAQARPRGTAAEEPIDDALFLHGKVSNVAADSQGVEVLLQEPLTLAGRVIDETDAPVTKFSVVAREKGEGMLGSLGARSVSHAFWSETGSFVLGGLAPGAWTVRAEAEGFGEMGEIDVEVPRTAPEELVLQIQHAATVAGRVVNWDGALPQKASVTLELGMQDISKMMRGDVDTPKTTVGPDGRFELAGLAPGSVILLARGADAASSVALPLDLAPGDRRENVVLTLREGGLVTGEIFGADGEPLVGVNVMIQVPTSLSLRRFGQSDEKGLFRFEHVEPGSWQVIGMPPTSDSSEDGQVDFAGMMSEMKMASAEVVEGEVTHVVLGAPLPDAVMVRGRVTLDGVPQASVLVNFLPHEKKGALMVKMSATNERGEYHVEVEGPGRYLVTLQKTFSPGMQNNVELTRTIPEGSEEFACDLELPLGAISGRISGPDGKPLHGARVTLTTDGGIRNDTILGGRYSEIAADERGEYLLEWLAEGTYTVSAGGSALGGLFGSGASAARETRPGLRVAKDQHMEGVDFRLKTPGKIVGSVLDAAGKPVAEASIFLRDSAGRSLEQISFVTTDAQGRFEYGGVAEGTFEVTARAPAQATASAVEARVRPGETTTVELRLAAATLLLVTLTDEEDREIDATVVVVDAQGRQVNGLVSLSDLMEIYNKGNFSAKEQRVGPLPSGDYKVTATAGDGRSKTKPVTLLGQAERRLKIRLSE